MRGRMFTIVEHGNDITERNYSELLDKLSSELQKCLHAFDHVHTCQLMKFADNLLSLYENIPKIAIAKFLMSWSHGSMALADLKIAIDIYFWMIALDVLSSFPMFANSIVFLPLLPLGRYCSNRPENSYWHLLLNACVIIPNVPKLDYISSSASHLSEMTNSLDVNSFVSKKSRKKVIQWFDWKCYLVHCHMKKCDVCVLLINVSIIYPFVSSLLSLQE